jgi:hypothetical protein
MKKFELGRLLITPGAKEEIGKHGIDVIKSVGRHRGGDWSDMNVEDQRENELSPENGYRIFSRYRIKGYRLGESERHCSA